MINLEEYAKVVDFDRAAKYGEGRYPPAINKSELAEEWYQDVEASGVLRIEYDEYAVKKVPKEKCQVH